MFDRRLAEYFDWGLLLVAAGVIAIGLTTLYSAVAGDPANAGLFARQAVLFLVGLGGMVLCFLVNFKTIEQYAGVFYVVSNLFLVAVLFIGKVGGGSRRWLDLGPFSFQPSELVKLAVILILARYFAKRVSRRGFTLPELAQPLLMVLLPFFLISRQPDLGTAMVVALIALTMTVFVKIERRSLVALVMGASGVVVGGWFLLKDYQKQRILTFLDPDRDPLGAGYHIIQSKIAIGSGMITGKGYLKGTQNALSFLPEQHTDFVFSVLAEEWGFAGTALTLLFFFILIGWGIRIAHRCRDAYGTIISFGITAMLFWQVVINTGMVMGLMPVVGVTLPFISYGGSSVITMMMGIGLLLNVSMRRFMTF